jgi:hypothetical protein
MSETTRPLPPSGWYRDPTGHGEARYWNGVAWTDSVSRGGVTFTAPVPPEQTRVPPLPGSEYHAPLGTSTPAPTPSAAPAPASKSSSSSTSILVAIALVAAAALIAVLLINLLGSDDDDDDPGSNTIATTPVSEAPPVTEAPPATETPTTGG